MRPDRGGARAARSLVFAAVALLLAGAAHTLGGGGIPSPATCAVAGTPLLLLSHALTSRRRGWPALITALGIAQAGLHLFFHAAALAPQRSVAVTGHHGLAAGPMMDGGSAAWAAAMPSPAMAGLHAVAVVATAYVLARGEALLWRAVDRLRPRLVVAPELRLVPAGPAALVNDVLCPPQWGAATRGGRGPPERPALS